MQRFQVRRVTIPYTDASERVISLVLDDTRRSTSDTLDEYGQLIRDPIEALQNNNDNFEPPEIIVIRSAPETDLGQEANRNELADPRGWVDGDGISHGIASGTTHERDDRGRIAIPSSSKNFWMLKPWIDPMLGDQKTEFQEAVSEQFRIDVSEVDDWLRSEEGLRDFMNGLEALRTRLRVEKKHRFNVTSLSLFSGPVGNFVDYDHCWHADGASGHSSSGAVGWLATGDAELRESGRRNRFLKHFQPESKGVGTFAPPHHGSHRNFHEDLLTSLDPVICIVGSGGRFKHPNRTVVEAIAKYGAKLIVADVGVGASLTEHVWAHY